MSPIDGFQEAVARLREARDIQVREGIEYEAVVAARDEVIGRYGPIFSPGAIDGLAEADFTSFLFFENNKH